MEFGSKESTDWIRLADNKQEFLTKLGVPADIKDRSYATMVPFLPIRVPITGQNWVNSVELENNLKEGSIASIRWIKQPSRRDSNQRVAHAIYTLTNPQAANLFIKDGLYVQKEKLRPKKERKEPLRYVRCQRWGHLARGCKAPLDICARCKHLPGHRTDIYIYDVAKEYSTVIAVTRTATLATCPLVPPISPRGKIPENSIP